MKHFDFAEQTAQDRQVVRSVSAVGTLPEPSFYERSGKRIFDLFLALALVPIIAPVVALICICVSRDGGPGLFAHTRVGRDGKLFRCWKIRTMVVDAEERLAQHLSQDAEAAAEWKADHKLTDDPRITKLGNFLRKTSLDELPQIWNVLRGDMSFVGPRPVVTAELPKYGVYAPQLQMMTPGITGLWQVSGRNEITYDERVQLDVQYLKNRTLLGDIAIILKTAGAVFSKTGR